MGTLASQAEIGVGVQAPAHQGASVGVRGYHLQKNLEIVYSKSCNLMHFGWKMVRSAVYNAFLNTLRMGTAYFKSAVKVDNERKSVWRRYVPSRTAVCPFFALSMMTRSAVSGKAIAWKVNPHCAKED